MLFFNCKDLFPTNRISDVTATIFLPNGFNQNSTQRPKSKRQKFTLFSFLITGMKIMHSSVVYETAYYHKSLHCIGILHKMTFMWKSLDLWRNEISQLISQNASYQRIFWAHANMTFVCTLGTTEKGRTEDFCKHTLQLNSAGHRRFGQYQTHKWRLD